jgi:MFS family permease
LWFAQLISTIGDAFTMIAAGIYIFRLTGSTMQVGLMLIATSVPTMLLGLFAGVFVDRYDRKKIMVAAHLSRAVLIFLIPFLLPYNLAWLYIIVMLTSSIGTFFDPAFDSVLPEIATDEELTAANSMIAISSFGSTAIGFAASGLIASYSLEWAFYIDAATFLISGLLLMSLKVPKIEVEDVTTAGVVFRNLQEGIQVLWQTSLLRSLLIVGAVYALSAGMWNTLLLPFATEVLAATEFQYGIQEGITSVGFVLGSFFMARYAEKLREGVWICLSLLLTAVFGMIYALSSQVSLATMMVFITGFLNAWYYVARRTLMQRNTNREMRGRIFGAMMTIGHVIMLIGMGIAGFADFMGIRETMIGAVLLTGFAGAVALVAPGIGQPAAEWLRAVHILRKAEGAPVLVAGRPAVMADFEQLQLHLPTMKGINVQVINRMLKDARFIDAAEGDVVVRHGDVSDAAYFIVNGRAIAGRLEGNQERVLEVLNSGDFFGEIAALTGIPRTANVVANQPTGLIRVPANTLREISSIPEMNRIFMSKMTERMIRMDMIEMPKMLTLDQTMLRELRTEQPITGQTAVQPA